MKSKKWKKIKSVIKWLGMLILTIITGKIILDLIKGFTGKGVVEISGFKKKRWGRHKDDAPKPIMNNPLNEEEADNEINKLFDE